jgi:hypothetical protein
VNPSIPNQYRTQPIAMRVVLLKNVSKMLEFVPREKKNDRNNLIRQLNWSRGRYAMQRIEVTNSDLVHLAGKIVLYDRRLEKV